jgi:tRNA G18 (ribose-2'-O)-methylase SpoU
VIIPVTQPDDPRISGYRAVKDRDLARHDGRFIVEGAIALDRLASASRFPVDSLFLAESRLEPLAPLLARFDPAIPVYAAPQLVMDAITGFHIHRGVLALAHRRPAETPQRLLAGLPPGPVTLLAMIGLANHDNTGACFRNAAALGASAVLLDDTSCDPLYRKSIRVSSGAALSVPFAHSGHGETILAALAEANITPWLLTPTNAEPLHALNPPERVAIVLGEEGYGLPASLLSQHRRVAIPMTGGMDSLNVATAGAIALAHVFAKRSTSRA